MPQPAAPTPRALPRASVLDTLRVAGTVAVPLLARGLIVRRPGAVRLAEAVDGDRRGVRLFQRLRRTYGGGPLRLRVPGRRIVVLLAPEHVHRVLAQSPEPFSPATKEKRSALGHFQPHGVLISTGADRADRRRFNEDVLDSGHAVHRTADAMVGEIRREVAELVDVAARDGVLDWDAYARTWWRMVRQLVLGASARDDEALTEDLHVLRATANWAFLHPRRRARRARFLDGVRRQIARAEPGSLAASMPFAHVSDRTDPEQQVPQWLFAFDAAAWASYRALALLASHPDALSRAREEIAGRDLSVPKDLPFLRAVVLESLRLWPTTPALLRETTAPTRWEGGRVPEDTLVLTYAPFFHRDDENLPEADRFAPELWTGPRTEADWPLVPFSAGPAECAGRNLVLHVTSTVLALLVDASGEDGPRLVGRHPLDPDAALPGTLDPFSLRFALGPARG
ncbi:cytochrome P450 [Cellulosimicrobium sp. NPDC057127]|uniref:cytochrome P450 n=1 Tax=Cellulosimicrobium sp. NPDC057127 TaxID=3346026 RepID=UPI003626C9B0